MILLVMRIWTTTLVIELDGHGYILHRLYLDLHEPEWEW